MGLQNRLRDMEANLGLYGHQVVHGDDGRLYLAWGFLPDRQSTDDAYPYLTPSLRMPELGDDELTMLDMRNASLVARMEHMLEDYGRQAPLSRTGDLHLSRANPLAVKQAHPFQVLWLGSRREWLVTEGYVQRLQYGLDDAEATIVREDTDQKILPGEAGWLVVDVKLEPASYEQGDGIGGPFRGYAMSVNGVRHAGEAPESKPPTLGMYSWGVIGRGTYRDSSTWSPGTVSLPLAYVEPPANRRAPVIRQVVKNGWYFTDPQWPGSLPHPINIPLF